MTFEVVDSVFTVNLDNVLTLALAAILLLIGYVLVRKVHFLEKFCIPAPVVGGFLFMAITWIGHSTGTFQFTFDDPFQSVFMLAFFTTVGLGASLQLLKSGGKLLIIYWLVCGVISIIQNAIGIGVSRLTGLEPPYALLASAISMIGGHGAALSYGTTFTEMGYPIAKTVGAAAATFGLISAVLLGGPLGRLLIERRHLTPSNQNFTTAAEDVNQSEGRTLTSFELIQNVVVIIVCMAAGSIIAGWISSLINMKFPTYVGAMFFAVLIRNLNEKFHFYHFDFALVDGIGTVTLNLYLSLALMTLALWELADLVGAVLLVVAAQVLFMAVVAYFIVFRILGADYDAAVMCAGLCGHGLGATPSAIVNMTAVNDRYGYSRKAMMIVPIVGAFLVDIIYQPQTIWFISTFVQNLK
ncbi:MAG: sodium/glutamate symporter [Peptoniphilaceae bacterium]|nr:sodium/glutamate symporter [Peptoniphilaceae bacterium]MDY6086159.1 sodium/glutamate symporter [Peptoniphilaceae bacterium]